MDETPTLARLFDIVRKNAGFRRLYAANAVSQVGDWLNIVALFSLLLELTGKGEAVALVLLTRLLPMFFIGPAAGVLADRISRRAILIACDAIRAALVLCLLFVRSPDQVWIAYAVMTLHAIASAFFEPAQAAIVPGLVPAQDLVLAGALENSLWSVTLALGSAAGGALLALVGRDAAFVFDAASFVASALLLRKLPAGRARRLDALADGSARETQPKEGQAPWETAADLPLSPPQPLAPVGFVNLLGLRDLGDGLRYVATHAQVRALIIVKSCFGLTLGGVLVLLAYFGERVFQHGGGAGIAALWTARGVGSFVGPLAAFRLVGHDEPALRRGILWSFISLVVCYLGFAASPGLWMAAGFLAVANAGGSTLWTYGSALLQQIVPDEVRGRVSAAEMGGMTLAMSTSTWVVGQLLDLGAAPRPLMAGCALVALVPVAFWLAVQPSFERART